MQLTQQEDSMRNQLGLIHVYTGSGKGKTTAALGLAMRALEHGLRVHMLQFLKGGTYTGELRSPERFNGNFHIEQFGKGSTDQPHYKDFTPDNEDAARAMHALARANELLHSGNVDVLILDEINVALQLGHLSWEHVQDIISGKPENVELVLTGRHAPEPLITLADYVTTMKADKHPYNKGILGRKGIDF